MKKNIFIIILFILIPYFALADMGPKPTMKFIFVGLPDNIKVIDGQQLQCKDKDCVNFEPLKQYGPQGFYCNLTSCSSLAYGYSNYHKLIISFSDKERESNIFKKESLNSVYEVKINSGNTLSIVDVTSFTKLLPAVDFKMAFATTIIIELLVSSIYLLINKLSKKLLLWVLLVNIITIPSFWLLSNYFNFQFFPYIISECAIIIFEAVLLKLLGRKYLDWKNALLMSFIMNLISIITGEIIFFLLNSIFF
jgi:hypothetical protein